MAGSTTVAIINAGGTPSAVRTIQNSDGSVAFLHGLEQNGAPATPTNPIPVGTGGSLGTGFSGLSSGVVGETVGVSTYGGSGLMAAYVLVASWAANSERFKIEIFNHTGQTILIVRDDGTAAAGSPPNNAVGFLAGGGSGAPSQGACYESSSFKGRVQCWAPSDPGVGNRPSIAED